MQPRHRPGAGPGVAARPGRAADDGPAAPGAGRRALLAARDGRAGRRRGLRLLGGRGPGPARARRLPPGGPLRPEGGADLAERGFFFRAEDGIRVADVTGVQTCALPISGPGTGGGPHVRVFSGATGELLGGGASDFFVYHEAFTGGVRVATGDVNGDGALDIITGAGPEIGRASCRESVYNAVGAETISRR